MWTPKTVLVFESGWANMPYTFDQIANPEKHGLAECPHCNGYGSSLNEKDDRCTQCGGTGLLTKEDALKYKETHK